jgi:two-component system, sensor histidine kinase
LALFSAALSEKARYPELRTLVANINKSVESLENLFNELLDISRLDAGVVQPSLSHFPLQSVFDRLRTDYELEAGEKGLQFRIVPTRVAVFSDPTLLERILRNLVSNAVRYTPRGGILIGCRHHQRSVRVDVCDTGIGIAEPELEKIFEEFYQVDNPERDRARGLGLGLAIVNRLEQLLGYSITVRSKPGKGSIFSVEVPGSHSATARPAKIIAEAESPENFKDNFVVVVDDERAVRDGMRELLSQWGCQVLTAASAEEALAELHTAKRLPAIIIADYRLRDGRTGIEAIERIRSALSSQTPGILITGDTAPDRLREAIASGYHLMHKPVSPPKLHLLLSSVLASEDSPPAQKPSP